MYDIIITPYCRQSGCVPQITPVNIFKLARPSIHHFDPRDKMESLYAFLGMTKYQLSLFWVDSYTIHCCQHYLSLYERKFNYLRSPIPLNFQTRKRQATKTEIENISWRYAWIFSKIMQISETKTREAFCINDKLVFEFLLTWKKAVANLNKLSIS